MDCNILVTGAAGFIGYHLCKKCLVKGVPVIGLDNMNDYYDINFEKNDLIVDCGANIGELNFAFWIKGFQFFL